MAFPLVPLSRSSAALWLSASELSLFIFAIIIFAGHLGEHKAHPTADPWMPRSIKPPNWRPPGYDWPKIWRWVVIIGVLGEMGGAAGVWISSDALWAISNNETESLRSSNLTLAIQVADAQKEATDAKYALEKYKALRLLTDEQKAKIAETLKLWSGQQVSFSITPGTDEAGLLRQIRETLTNAGWVPIGSQVGDVELDGAGIIIASGVIAQVTPESARGSVAAAAANALAAALTSSGVAARAEIDAGLKNASAVNVAIGAKP